MSEKVVRGRLLIAFLSAVGGSYSPVVNKMQSKEEFLKTLGDGVSEDSHKAWQAFLYNIEQVRLLGDVSTENALLVIAGGSKWNGSGWTTSRASQRLHSLTQVPLVTAEFNQYRNAWLYCLSMLWNVEVTELTLSDAAAEAAFRLASVCSQGGEWMEEDEEEEEQEADAYWTGLGREGRPLSTGAYLHLERSSERRAPARPQADTYRHSPV
jgi:hypothetical protein